MTVKGLVGRCMLRFLIVALFVLLSASMANAVSIAFAGSTALLGDTPLSSKVVQRPQAIDMVLAIPDRNKTSFFMTPSEMLGTKGGPGTTAKIYGSFHPCHIFYGNFSDLSP